MVGAVAGPNVRAGAVAPVLLGAWGFGAMPAAAQPAETPGLDVAPSAGEAELPDGDAGATVSELPPSDGSAPLPKRDGLGPFTLRSPAGDTFEIQFAAQLLLNARFGPDRDASTTFVPRRLRTVFKASLLDERLRLGFQINTSPASLELLDVWGEWAFPGGIRLRVGQTKVPFTRYRGQSFAALTLVDWGINTRMFGAERQLGAVLHTPQDHPLEVHAAVMSGQNARNTHGVGPIDVYGDERGNPSNLRDPAPPDDLHPELFLLLLHRAMDLDDESGSDAQGGAFRGLVGLSAAWDLRPNPTEDFALRVALETLMKAGGWGLTAVAYAGALDPTESGGVAMGAVSALVELDRRLASWLSLTARFALEERLDPLLDDARARAERLVAANPLDPAAQARLDDAAALRRRLELAGGLNAYLAGQDVKIQIDGAWLREVATRHAGGGARNDARIRLQLQLRL
jgi:hypothetical protein